MKWLVTIVSALVAVLLLGQLTGCGVFRLSAEKLDVETHRGEESRQLDAEQLPRSDLKSSTQPNNL